MVWCKHSFLLGFNCYDVGCVLNLGLKLGIWICLQGLFKSSNVTLSIYRQPFPKETFVRFLFRSSCYYLKLSLAFTQ